MPSQNNVNFKADYSLRRFDPHTLYKIQTAKSAHVKDEMYKTFVTFLTVPKFKPHFYYFEFKISHIYINIYLQQICIVILNYPSGTVGLRYRIIKG